MHDLKRILLLKADHQPASDDLAAATALARRAGAAITFADMLPDGESISDFFRGEHRRELNRLMAPHGEGLEIAYRLLSGSVDDALKGIDVDYDLIFAAGGSDRFHTELLRAAPRPVWVPGTAEMPPRRILAAIDVDDTRPVKRLLNRRLLDDTLSLARLLDAEVEIASVWTPPGPAGRLAERGAPGGPMSRREAAARKRAEAVIEEAFGGLPVTAGRPPLHLAGGNPAELLAEITAVRSIDLVVAGHSGRAGLPAWLRRNTAETLADRVDCSLLVVTVAAADDEARAA